MIDLKSGYWQIEMGPASVDKTAFVTERGCFAWRRIPFSVAGACSLFQRLMDKVLRNVKGSICLVYLDDELIF